ncbi:diguanylate cyclase [Klebsiella michiganensis]|uniref:Diguanylate cyclase n=1 Tax=Klebsiella michiganensis TaxID=1134687 RepID=A0A7H4N1A2_9ENTR|nr:diguanylate cyclase [Klebsiella michiganensis]
MKLGDMAQAIRIFRENGLARQRLEQERDADWAVRELLARMTQRLQGCESFEDVIKVAELFAPKYRPGDPGPAVYSRYRSLADALRGAVAFSAA